MQVFKLTLILGLVVSLTSLAVLAQDKTARTASWSKSATEQAANRRRIERINTDGLKDLISKSKDRPLLVNFWATFCDPCRDEFPDLVKIDAEFRPKSLDFVTVSLDDVSDIKTKVPEFLTQMKATMPAYLLDVTDPEPAINAVDPKWQGDLPATFLYDAKGTIVFKHFGRVNTAELRAAIEQQVKK